MKKSLLIGAMTALMAFSSASAQNEPIFETPDGTVKSYYRISATYQADFSTGEFLIYPATDYGVIGQVVEGSDGFVYFKNPIAALPSGSYMKGEKKGDEIVFTLPQPIYYMDGLLLNIDRLKLTSGIFGDDFFPDTENHEIRYKINADGTYSQVQEEGICLGAVYADDDSWAFLGDVANEYMPMTDTPVTLPDGLEVKDYAVTAANGARLCKVAISGSDIYLGGLRDAIPDAWCKGTLEGGKATFAPYQYMAPSEEDSHYVYFTAGAWDPAQEDVVEAQSLVFDWDEAAATLTAANPTDCLVINAGKDCIYWLEYFENPAIKPFELKPATPANPTVEFEDNSEWDEISYLYVNMPVLDTEGNMLDTKCMTYCLYMDGEKFTFYPDEYEMLEEEITDLPYDFTDDYDIYVSGPRHTIAIYSTGFDQLGVQVSYTVDGVTNKSAIVYVGEDSVAEIEGKTRQSVEYFDLTGRRVSKPEGFVIKRSVYTDGTVKTAKTVLK